MNTVEENRRQRLILLEQEFGSQVALSNQIGKSAAQISQWKNASKYSGSEKRRVMDRSTARHIEKMTGKPEGWMDQPPNENVEPSTAGSRKVPLISYVQAGNMTEIVDSYAVGAAAEWLLTDLDLSTSAFALKIKGDSMSPEFREGDTVIIDPAITPLPGDYVVAKNGKEEATFKKYRPRGLNERGDEVFELVPLNDDYASIRSDLSPARIIGTMVEHRRYRKR